MKENFNKAVEWGKKNPIVMLVLFGGILFIFFRRPGEVADPEVVGERVTGQAFPQPFEKYQPADRAAVREPEALQEERQDARPIRMFFETKVVPHETPALIPGWRPRIDYDVLTPQLYKDVIARKHAAMVPGRPDRPVANGLIKTVAHGWQTPQQIKDRQYARYARYRDAGDVRHAEKVRRETELAIGQRTGW